MEMRTQTMTISRQRQQQRSHTKVARKVSKSNRINLERRDKLVAILTAARDDGREMTLGDLAPLVGVELPSDVLRLIESINYTWSGGEFASRDPRMILVEGHSRRTHTYKVRLGNRRKFFRDAPEEEVA